MNKDRRKQIEEVKGKLEEVQGEICAIASDERDYYDNMAENLQGGERGERAQEVADNLDEIDSQINDILDTLDDAMS